MPFQSDGDTLPTREGLLSSECPGNAQRWTPRHAVPYPEVTMFRFPSRLILLSGLVVVGFASGQETQGVSAEGVAFFEKKIRPVLVTECYECHSTEKAKK